MKNNVVWNDVEDWGYTKPFNISALCPKCKKEFDVESQNNYDRCLIETKYGYTRLRNCPYCDTLYFHADRKPIKLISELKWYEKIMRRLL